MMTTKTSTDESWKADFLSEEETYEYDLWTHQMVTLFTKYKDVQFYRVGSKIIEPYNNLDNVIHIKYEDFKDMI